MFAGDLEAGGIPSAFSYDPYFSPVYDFSTGYLNIDSGGFSDGDTTIYTTVDYVDQWQDDWGTFDDFDLTYDSSGLGVSYDNWTWEDEQTAFATYSYDSWDYGTWFEPVILDLNGDGVDITQRTGSGAYFDIDGVLRHFVPANDNAITDIPTVAA